jgi:hypothetical protein
LVQQIADRVGRALERAGLITHDIDTAYLAFDPGEEPSIHTLLGSSITYRIATGPREGQKVFTLQTLPAAPAAPRLQVAERSGFSLHAGIAATASQPDKLEHLARYVARPPVATERLALTGSGQVRYTLTTPYRDGTTHVIFEPEDFMARLAALVPKPRAHLTRYHGVCAPHGKLRAAVTPAHRGIGAPQRTGSVTDSVQPPTPRQVAMSWARRLKRVFGIEIEDCARCGGKLRVIASIEEPEVIEKILAHLERTPRDQFQPELPLGARAPPQQARLI